MNPVLTVTLNPAIDISSEVKSVRPTQKTRTSRQRQDPGGGGINMARVILRLGGEVETLFLAGGETGLLLERLVGEEGIYRHVVPIAGATRISFMIYERDTGLEYRFVPEGPKVTRKELQACFDAIANHHGDYVAVSGSLPHGIPADTHARMARIANDRGARFILDSSGAGLKSVLGHASVFLIKPNLEEFRHLAGKNLGPDDVGRLASEIVASGSAEFVAVTLGPDGALLAGKDGVLRLPAFDVPIRSAVGAGDSFLGAMIWALAEGRPVDDAFRYGVAAGAAAVMTPGTELCRREDIDRLYEKGLSETRQLR